jgi:hypothetical protein
MARLLADRFSEFSPTASPTRQVFHFESNRSNTHAIDRARENVGVDRGLRRTALSI